MYIPMCAVEVINGECATGFVYQYMSPIVLTASDLKQLIGAGLIPMATAYVFRAIRKTIND
ncbi:hypothetical protein O1O06_16295 [Grimontia hollisae]|uniref:hypothetical protein n=1 Tax=Grimontia hollisae TaxID=673 RepID=UPI0023DC9A71|nr:hypothetical protein [Grimontia hollisae]MDF2186302.1 hypothetical protein [Grimontia hollisae]